MEAEKFKLDNYTKRELARLYNMRLPLFKETCRRNLPQEVYEKIFGKPGIRLIPKKFVVLISSDRYLGEPVFLSLEEATENGK